MTIYLSALRTGVKNHARSAEPRSTFLLLLGLLLAMASLLPFQQVFAHETARPGNRPLLQPHDHARNLEGGDHDLKSPEALPAVLDIGRTLLAQLNYVQALKWYDRAIKAASNEAGPIAKARDDLIAALPADQKQTLERLFQHRMQTGNVEAGQNYLLLLALARRYDQVVLLFDRWDMAAADLPDDKLYWVGWSYFQIGRPERAEQLLTVIAERNPDHLPARFGLTYCWAAMHRFQEAETVLSALTDLEPGNTETAFALAYLREKQGRFWEAVQVYDGLLQRQPDNSTARRLRIMAMSDAGGSSQAARMAREEFPEDDGLRQSIIHDQAVDLLHWGEAGKAARLLQSLVQSSARPVCNFDWIVALAEGGRHPEAVEAYERAIASGQKPPAWVKKAAAGAYLASGQPDSALDLFDEVLRQVPDDSDARMGKLNALEQLRRWSQAETLLEKMQTDTPAVIAEGRQQRSNPAKLDLAVERAWLLADQNRLQESDADLQALYAVAPASLDVRNAMAHVHLWRGWPRKALQEFRIIETLDPDYQPAQAGHIAALNSLADKAQARSRAALLLEQRPRDLRLRDVTRDLSLEQLNSWRTEVSADREDNQTFDMMLHSELSTPLSLKTRLSAFVFWRRTETDDPASAGQAGDDGEPVYFNRAGAGIDHIFNGTFRLSQRISANYDDGRDWGSYTRLDYTPDDHWALGLYGDTFTTDFPARARLAGIEAGRLGADLTWRQSEWRQAEASYARSNFSDGNDRDEVLLEYAQNLWAYHDWRIRFSMDFYSTWNSKGDRTVYFNPAHAWELSAGLMTEQTVYAFHGSSFVHRLYLRLGGYRQQDYDDDWVGSLRYEQSFEFSGRQAFQWSLTAGRNVYDGEGVDDVGADMVYHCKF